MPNLSEKSLARLATCDERLQIICREAIKIYDFTILCGHRGEEEQEKLFLSGQTKLHYPLSKHNSYPSQAVDIVPYPVDWNDAGRFKLLAGIMFGIAHSHNIKLRWGGDWDGDWDMNDQKFYDLPHFELV